MLYKNLSVKELYASIPDAKIIADFFEIGLEIGSSQLAVSAMEELMFRGNADIIIAKLNKSQLRPGNSLTSMIARSLVEYRENPILHKYGKALLQGHGSEGILKWLHTPREEDLSLSEKSPGQDRVNGQKPSENEGLDEAIIDAINEGFEPQGF